MSADSPYGGHEDESWTAFLDPPAPRAEPGEGEAGAVPAPCSPPPPGPPLIGRAMTALPEVGATGVVRDKPRLIFKPAHALAAILVLMVALAASLTLFIQQSASLAGSFGESGKAAGTATDGRAADRKREKNGKKEQSPSGGKSSTSGSGKVSGDGKDAGPGQPASGSATAPDSSGFPPPQVRNPASGAGDSGAGGGPVTGQVDINTATVEQLQGVRGVGPVMARRIVEHRGRIGRFSSVDQLLDVSGIGPKTLEKLRAFLEVR